MQSIIKDFVNGAVSAYMTEVIKKNISGSITKKNLDISQLEVFPDALLQHGFPLLVKKGTIKNISIQIPIKFKTDPVKITIDSVMILGSLCTHDPTREQVIDMKLHMLNAYKFFRKRFKMLLGIMPKQSFLSIIRTIFSNIILDINHIHIQIEYPTGSIEDIPESQIDLTASKTFLSKSSLRSSRLSDMKSSQPKFNITEEESQSQTNDEKSDNSDQDLRNFNSKSEAFDSNEAEIDDFYEESIDEMSDSNGETSDPSPNLDRMATYKNFGTVYDGLEEMRDAQVQRKKVTSIGITINNLLLHNPENYENPSPYQITKEAVFTDLAIYMDVDQPSVDTSSNEKCEAEMIELYNSTKHNFILEPFTFSGLIKFEKGNPQLFFEPFIKTVMANIREEYIPAILELMKGVSTFQKKFSVAHIPKPSIDDPEAFWLYLHRCAVSKISTPTFDFSKDLSLLLKRMIYLKNYKKTDPKSVEIIKNLEESLDYSTIVAFRAAYVLTHRKRAGKSSLITPQITKNIKKISMVDPIYIVTKLVRMLAMNFTGENVTIALLRNTGEKHVVIDVKNPRFTFEKDLKAYIIHAVVSYVRVKHIKDTEITVFRSLDNNSLEMKANMKIPFLSYLNWSISLEMTKNNYFLNLKGILQLVTDFGLIELMRSSLTMMAKQKRSFELNVQIRSSALRVVGSQNNRAIQFAFDKLGIATDPATLVRTIKLENSWISLLADNEAKVSSDFSFSGMIDGKNISLSIPLFTCAVPFNYIVVIEDFIRVVMGYQNLFMDAAFPKPDVNFKLDMKGMNAVIKIPNSTERTNLQIRNIVFTFEKDKMKLLLASIDMSKLFSLKNLSFTFDQKSLNLKISYIYAKVFMLLSLIPKDAFQMLQGNSTNNESEASNNNTSVEASKEEDSDKEDSVDNALLKANNIELPNIKIGCGIDEVDIDLAITNTERFNLNVKNINALIDKNQIKAGAVLNQWAFQNQIIAQQISFQSEIVISKIFEIKIIVDNCNIALSKSLISYLLNVNMSSYEVAFPHELSLKISFILNQMSISNDFVMKNFLADVVLSDSKFDVSVGMDSVNSSFLKFVSKDVVKMNMDIEQKSIDLVVNLEDMTIFVIPLFDLISKLPAFIPSTPQIKLNLLLKPLVCNCVFGEDYLNIIFNSPLTLKLDTTKGLIPYVDLNFSNFLIHLNNNEILRLDSFKFSLTNEMIIEIPELYVKLSMLKIYKLLKMLTTIPIKKLMSDSQEQINLNEMPLDLISVKVPNIEIMMHQTKSRRCVLFILDDSEVKVTNENKKTELSASTTVHLNASDGFQSFSLAPTFNINCNGEFSETQNKIILESPDPIRIEFSTYFLNQIIKNLTANEDTAERPYSISNETGADITIIVKGEDHLIQSEEFLPNVHNFSQSDIKIKIDDIVNPIKIDSLASAISYPLFFGKSYILVWMDLKRLQLRLLSPISLSNKSRLDLQIRFLDEKISLDDGETYSLEYTIEKLDSISVKYDGEYHEIQLHEPQVINIGDQYVVVKRKRKEDTLHTTIEFTTPYYLKNELINDLTLKINDHQIVMKPTEVVPCPYFPPASDVISFDILDTPEIKGVHVDLQMKERNEEKLFVPTVDKEEKPFMIQFTFAQNNCICISSLIIFYNSLSVPLLFGLSNKEKIVDQEKCYFQQSLPSFFPFQSTQTIWKRDNPIMISPSIKNMKKSNVYVRTKYSSKWSEKPISISNFNHTEDLVIPFDDNKVCPTHFHVLSHNSMRPNTFIFFILPKFVINNLTNKTFSVNLFDGGEIEMPPNSCIPVTLIRSSFEFSLAVVLPVTTAPSSPSKKRSTSSSSSKRKSSSSSSSSVIHRRKYLVYSHKINLLKINSQFIKINQVDSPVLLQQSTENEIQFITILLNRTLPFLFVNNSKSKVIFIQKGTGDFAHTVMPNEKLPFFIFDENMPTIIHCEIGNQYKFDLDVNVPSFPVKIEPQEHSHSHEKLKYFYYVDLSIGEGSTITLCSVESDEDINRNSSSMTSSNSNMNLAESTSSFNLYELLQKSQNETDFRFNFSFLSVLLITRTYKELTRLTLKDIVFVSKIKQTSVKSEVTVGTIKVDDQDPYAVYPSVFQILSSETNPAVRFKFESFGSCKYGSVELQLQPITVRIDLSFMSDVVGSLLHSERLIEAPHEDHESVTEGNLKLAGQIPDFVTSEVSLSEFFNNFAPKNKKYHINHITIGPFKINLSFKTATTRSDHPLQTSYHFNRLVKLIPSLNNVSISIEDSYSFSNLSGTTAEIVMKIGNDVKKMIMKQLSLRNIIHESGTMVVNTAKDIIHLRGSTGSSILSKTGSVLSVAETALCHISSVLDLYTNTPPNIRTDETSLQALSWGFRSLCRSLKDGAKALVDEPKRYGVVNGKTSYCGYVEGCGVAAAKFAAFGCSGLCNFGASILSSTRRVFFAEKHVFVDSREIEPLLGMHGDKDEKLLWFNGSVTSNLIEVYSRSVFALEGNKQIHNVVDVELNEEDNVVVLVDEKENRHEFEFDDIREAMPFYNIIQSQLLRQKIVEGNTD